MIFHASVSECPQIHFVFVDTEITWTADEKNIDDFEVAMNSVDESYGVTSYLNVSSKHFSGEESISRISCIARNNHGVDEKSFVISVGQLYLSPATLIHISSYFKVLLLRLESMETGKRYLNVSSLVLKGSIRCSVLIL